MSTNLEGIYKIIEYDGYGHSQNEVVIKENLSYMSATALAHKYNEGFNKYLSSKLYKVVPQDYYGAQY